MSAELQTVSVSGPIAGTVPPSRGANNALVGIVEGEEFGLGSAGHAANNVQPTAMPGQTGCAVLNTFFDLYYNRYHVIPTQLDLGIVTDDLDSTVYVWNAYFSPKTLSAVAITADGVTTGLAIPQDLQALEVLDVPIHVDGGGAATVDGEVIYTFPEGDVSMRVAGIRSILFGYPMQWADQFKRSVEFKTEVFMSRSGKEQRRALRKIPRLEIEASLVAPTEKFESVREALLLRQDVSAVVPDFARRARLASPAAETDTAVSLESSAPWIQQGATLVIADPNFEGMRTATVKSVSGTSVELSSSLGKDYDAGAIVFPGLAGMLDSKLSLKLELADLASMSYMLKVFPESVPVWDRAWGDQYDGRDFMNIRPNWMGSPTLDHAAARENIDYGWGRYRVYLPRDYNTVTFRATWRALSSADIEVLEDFFVRQRGMARSFWMPSWTKDMTPVLGFSDTESVLKIAGTGVQKMNGHKLWKAIRVRLKDGTEFRRKITDIVDPGDGNSTLVLDQQWGQTVALDDILSVEWMYLARLATDKIEIQFHTDEAADVTFSMQAVEG